MANCGWILDDRFWILDSGFLMLDTFAGSLLNQSKLLANSAK